MKIRRRFSTCQNCAQMLDRNTNYCPVCGQENDDKIISFNIILNEFVSTFFALDNSFLRTLKPFLLNPGYLTNQFLLGKRRSFANPIRLYLIMSIFYFFVIGLFGSKVLVADEDSSDSFNNGLTNQQLPLDSLANQDTDEVGNILSDRTELDSAAQNGDIDKDDLEQIQEYNDAGQQFYKMGMSYAKAYQTRNYDDEEYRKELEEKAADSTAFVLSRINSPLIRELDHKFDASDREILDSMRLGNLKWWEEYLAIQVIRVEKNGEQAITDFMINNLSLMMLLVIPFFALVLKVMYIRKKKLYVQHLIHALHLHSFAYFVYGISLLVLIYLVKNETLAFIIWLFSFIGVSTYAYISFIRVYRQRWFKTLVKFNIVGGIYLMMIFMFFLLETALSFLLF